MNIPLNDGYRLSADKYQWIIQRRREYLDDDGNEVWKSMNYHPSPEAAIKYHANTMIRTSEAETLTEALIQIDRVISELSAALNGKFTVEKVAL